MMCFGAKVADIAPDQRSFLLGALILKRGFCTCRHACVPPLPKHGRTVLVEANFCPPLLHLLPPERANERTLLFLFKVHPACVLRRSSTELPFIHLCCVCSSLVSFQRVARAGERLTMTLFSSAPSKLNRELQRPKFPSHFTHSSIDGDDI